MEDDKQMKILVINFKNIRKNKSNISEFLLRHLASGILLSYP